MQVVINKCYGGFGLSFAAIRKIAKLKGFKVYFYITSKYEHRDGVSEYKRIKSEAEVGLTAFAMKENLGETCGAEALEKGEMFNDRDIERHDPDLVAAVLALGKKSYGQFAKLVVVEVPDDVEYTIEEYDGQEWIAERHRTWG